MIEKAIQDLETNIRSSEKSEWTISKRSLHESHEEPRGERDVIRLRNPTEDKRAFRRMLTSADRVDSVQYDTIGVCLWVWCKGQ